MLESIFSTSAQILTVQTTTVKTESLLSTSEFEERCFCDRSQTTKIIVLSQTYSTSRPFILYCGTLLGVCWCGYGQEAHDKTTVLLGSGLVTSVREDTCPPAEHSPSQGELLQPQRLRSLCHWSVVKINKHFLKGLPGVTKAVPMNYRNE